MRTNPKVICSLIALLLIGAGAAGIYGHTYTANSLVDFLCYGSLYLGWITLLFCIFGRYLLYDRRIRFRRNRRAWLKSRAIQAIVYILFAASTIPFIAGLRESGKRRNNYLLDHQPTGQAIALVTRSEGRQKDGFFRRRAVISYVTATGKSFIRQLDNSDGRYLSGQHYLVLYSVEHPEVFRVLHEMR